MLDAEKVKKDFRIFANRPSMAYLDSAATSQRPEQVIEAVCGFYRNSNSNISRGLYRIAEEATLAYEAVREKTSGFIGAESPSSVVFTKNTTESVNLIMRGWGWKNIKKGSRIVATIAEHHSDFVPWQWLAKAKKAEFSVVGIKADGRIDLADLDRKLKGASLLAFSPVSNVIGAKNDPREICRMAHSHGALAAVDAAQLVPSAPVDVRRMGCDFLSFSGHKMLAPFGSGVLYGKQEHLEGMDPLIYGSAMIRRVDVARTEMSGPPQRFEAGTPAVDAVIGLGAAIDYLGNLGMDNVRAHEEMLVGYMLDRLGQVPGLRIIGPEDARLRAGIASFTVDGIHPHDISALLAEDDVCVRSGHHCAMPLHESLSIQASTRASVYAYNTREDIDRLEGSLRRAIRVFGKRVVR